MSRSIQQDFNEVKDYLDQFNLKNLLNDPKYIDLISIFHKKYFSFFTLIAELEGHISENDYSFLKEANSDLITSFFHLITGSYKSSKLLLRSSIECFLKGFTLSWIPEIHKEKRVYEIFKEIKIIPYFNNEPFKSELSKIHSIYKTLCKDVHTSDKVNMASINSLNFFPKYSFQSSKSINDNVLMLIPVFCFLLCNKYNNLYHKMHYTSKETILKSISKKYRPIIMNTES